MRTLLVTALALTLAVPALAQRAGFALGVATSADVYRYDDKHDPFNIGLDHRFRLRQSVGVQAHYVTSSRFALTTGLRLSDKGRYFRANRRYPLAGTTDPSYTVNERELYLEVPLKLGYNLHLTDRLALTPTSGAVIGTEIARSFVVTESTGDRISGRSGIRLQPLYHLSIPLELHLDWLVGERFAVSAAPHYRFDVRLYPYRGRLHSYGFLLDLRYYLK